MIDLRCHILDGTPCGPKSFGQSLEMCRAAASEGVTTIVATPRWEVGCAEPPLPYEECRRRLEHLRTEMRGTIALKLGFVFQFSADLPDLVRRHGSKLALAGKRHLLISIPSVEVPAEAESVWKSLARAGFSVVLAHPECNTVLRRDAGRLMRWVSEGITLQVDAASVVGAHGREVRRFAFDCLRKYKGSAIVASNMRHTMDRKGLLGNVREVLVDNMGGRQAENFMRDAPAALIEDGVMNNKRSGLTTHSLSSFFRSARSSKPLTGEF